MSDKSPEIHLLRCDSTHPEFVRLVRKLDAYLAVKDGADHAFYDQYNQIEDIRNVVLAFQGERAVGCGAFKPRGEDVIEIKRMYVDEAARRMGVAGRVLAALETWAVELGRTRCVLETGRRQTEAVAFYRRRGYAPIDKFPPYEDAELSLCFARDLVD